MANAEQKLYAVGEALTALMTAVVSAVVDPDSLRLLYDRTRKIRELFSVSAAPQWDYLSRKKHRENGGIPPWVPIGDDDPEFRRLFVEDDAKPPDAEVGREAWKRIFEEDLDETQQKEEYNGGDHIAYLMPGNRVFISAYDGTSIYQWMPPRKFK